jgi:purine-binding chemotaxis protein CheW
MDKQLVVFKLGNEFYGVNIEAVESIIKMQSITVVPQAPEYVEGVTNLRGTVLPVIDLRKRFGIGHDSISKDSRIIVVTADHIKVGMIVDAVSEVLEIGQDAIEPPPAIATTLNSAFITGIAKSSDQLVILLDLSQVLQLHTETKGLPLAV